MMKILPRKPLLRKLIGVAAGIGAGYAYYAYVGCVSGTCPISSNPWISSAYGACIGWLVTPALGEKDHGRKGEREA